MSKRMVELKKQIESRIALAEKEMKEARDIRLINYTLINDIFEQAIEEFILIIKKELA